MNKLGHNERSFRLDALAAEAREGLAKIEQGEEFTISGWLTYGHALNKGRALHDGDREFGQWVEANVLSQVATAEVTRDDRAAAMWAAANADEFEEARQRGNPRTIRGIHAKWKEIKAEREDALRAEEKRKREESEKAEREKRAAEALAAKEKADAEAEEARKAAEAAKDDEERKAAQERAEKAEKARAEAEAAAEKAKEPDPAPPAPDPEPIPDPYGYSTLTDEALLETANGLRAELDEVKAKLKAVEAKLRAAKEKTADLSADDKNLVVRRLQKELDNAENAKWKALEDRDAYHRQVYALKKRVAELENMGIPL
ncbi:hypothetical protein RAZWK3B_15493 [Roseobacter sp. AzwK-3b]|uniref:hypothetical protein n=1 Tax=Roseobacter sp. AzwK-3b TaxID=351016 RepID=UPI000156A4DF|nr:hypothetical protein [Roseobacter sp. AzwK-3b]EDM70814.1 hypothetical protein RAZWK3B_15493 [Roseobacter sp. AzwK-3b]